MSRQQQNNFESNIITLNHVAYLLVKLLCRPFNLTLVLFYLVLIPGRVAALNMLHKEVELNSVPFYWTVLLGMTIRYTGVEAGPQHRSWCCSGSIVVMLELTQGVWWMLALTKGFWWITNILISIPIYFVFSSENFLTHFLKYID